MLATISSLSEYLVLFLSDDQRNTPLMKQLLKNFHYKRSFRWIAVILLSFTLYACPFSSPYKLDAEPSIPADDKLLGKWSTVIRNKRGGNLPIEVLFSKKNDMEYNVLFSGNFSDLMPNKLVADNNVAGSAYISMAANKELLSIELKGQTYISELVYKNDTLSLLPLADGFTAKYIKSNAQLRTAVEFHFKTRAYPCFDELFCLKGMTRAN